VSRKSLLLVDSDPRSRGVLEGSLRNAGYELIVCSDVGAAREALTRSLPDAVLVDAQLPGVGGLAFVERLRGQAGMTGVPVLFLGPVPALELRM
jgi:DNA-binding response OmpR family regulator